MNCIDRRGLLMLMLGAASAATIGSSLVVQLAQAAPLPPRAGRSEDSDSVLQQAQFGPPPRHRRRRRGWGFGPRRRWHCWWHRGRRVCGWRRW
jgi:hypothetical protein